MSRLLNHKWLREVVRLMPGVAVGCALAATTLAETTPLADKPVLGARSDPGNLALALSVEYPTAVRTAHTGAYSSETTYLGYFDPEKCYTYKVNTGSNGVTGTDKGDLSYFQPAGRASSHKCTGNWSGNFLNWASTPTIDPFRWAMTGGRRVVDTETETILEKGFHSTQAGFANRNLEVAEIAGATPFNLTEPLAIKIHDGGFKMHLGGPFTFQAQYFSNTTLSDPAAVTVAGDSADHTWGSSSPANGIPADRFSARFTGTFTAPESGAYRFRLRSDDGARVWVDQTGSNNFNAANLVVDDWSPGHGARDKDSADIEMTAGQSFSVRIQYYENTGSATLRLSWKTPSTQDFTVFSLADRAYTMRVKVCDPSPDAGGLESNCKAYGTNNYKPEGLIQQYANKMRFSAFGYLNDDNPERDGGVLRASQKFVGPVPPGSAENSRREWNPSTGVFVANPDVADATATGVTNSGVINYLNKFGQLKPGSYKSRDPVNELYYAVLRYYRKLGNVSAWSNLDGATADQRATWVDGFPVITNWEDPVENSCQRHFILGIGDIYTHNDKNIPGNTDRTSEPPVPREVASDPINQDLVRSYITATKRVGELQGMDDPLDTKATGSLNSRSYMAGMAFDANTFDNRPEAGKQTIQTYWVDVLERPFENNNKFYLAAKYGGLKQNKLPADFNPYTFDGTIPLDWWSTNGELLSYVDGKTTKTTPRPDNYFAAGKPDTMIKGLREAFERISQATEDYSTSLALSSVETSSGDTSYAARYDASNWTSVVSARTVSFDATTNAITTTAIWDTSTTLEAQLAGNGWKTRRRVATWNGSRGVGFTFANLTDAQKQALETSPVATGSASEYLDYLRGDRSQERTDSDLSKPYRKRAALLGDITNSGLTAVGAPKAPYSEAINQGYAAFKNTWASRPTIVYAGANDGMLHAFNGAATGDSAGTEQFAYVPGELFITGHLNELGNPAYAHRNFVDATPEVFDVDFNVTHGNFLTTSSTTSDWHSILVGGLGKGGRSYYAIDVTDPAGMSTEAAVAGKVLWEFTDTTMGFSFGAPNVVKTRKYGWVVVLTSGYNSPAAAAGKGYIYFVNPKTGELLEKVATASASSGLTHASIYVSDFSDGTADAVYVGDLNGQLWRFDITASRESTASYPAGVKLAQAADSNGNAQPITTPPLIEVQPATRKRMVMFGTGKLLDTTDIKSTKPQSFYAILDGTSAKFAVIGDPVTRSDLVDADLINGSAVGNAKGWYIDLGVDSTTGVAWRQVNKLSPAHGVVAFSPMLTTGDECEPSAKSRTYVIDFSAAKSVLRDTPADQPYLSFDQWITGTQAASVDGKNGIIVSGRKDDPKKLSYDEPLGQGVRLRNWREVPIAD